MDIVDWAQSPYGFYVDRRYDPAGRWVLEPGPIRLAEYHAAILRHCFTPGDGGRLPYDVIAWCEPAKSGKSAICGLVAEYVALHGEQNSQIVMASNKQRQAASLMYKSLTDSIEYNPHLPHVAPGSYAVTFRNGNTVTAIPSNSRGEAGARFSLAVFDELWGYQYQDSERLWSEFKSDPTRLNSVKLATGYAGYLESELWLEQLERGLAGEPVPELADIVNDDGEPACWRNGRHFTFWSHKTRQPWQTNEWIESQRRSLRPSEFRRMILTLFVEGVGDFVDADAWSGLVDAGALPLEPGDRQPVYVGLDLAVKPGGDDCALIAVYERRDGKLAVAFHKVWHGGKERRRDLKLSETVEPYLLRLCRTYNVACIACDPWQGMGLAQRLRARGLPVIEIPQTHARRAPADTALYDLARNGDLILYDHPELRHAAAYANAKELGDGRLFIQKRGRGKIDLLIALSLSLCALAAGGRAYDWRVVYAPAYG